MTRVGEGLFLAGLLTTVVVAGVLATVRATWIPVSLLVMFASVTLSVTAFLLRRDEEQAGHGLLLYGAAVSLVLSDAEAAVGGAGEWVGRISTWWAVPPLAVVLLTYPGRRVTRRWHRWLLVAVAADFVVLWSAAEVARWSGSVLGGLLPVVDRVLVAGGVVLPLLAAAALVQRWRGAAAPERTAVRSVTAVGLALAGTFAIRVAVGAVTDTAGAVAALQQITRVANLACLALAPVGLLLEALRRRAARTAVIESLLVAGGDPAGIQDAMARALSDPTARLAFPLDEPERHLIDVTGSATDIVSEGSGRIVRELAGAGGGVVAFAEVDEATGRDAAQLRVVLACASITLDNARLQARLARSLEEVRSSRGRIVEAGIEARRRLERDLHDGAQQQLLAVAASLTRAEIVHSESDRVAAVGDAKVQLASALDDLRRLARGIHPAVLSQGGLAAALPTLADAVPFPLHLDVPPEVARSRLPTAVESTIWFVAAEALTNTARHGNATEASLRLRISDGSAILTVRDDGRGGARLRAGGGLSGLADRVGALDGTLLLESPASGGTRVEAVLRCMW